jgi:diguanylate cyclase (GGDEF)-like protein
MPHVQPLTALVSEFATTMATDFPIQAVLDDLVERIIDVLPVSAASVAVIVPGEDPDLLAGSDGSALWLAKLQVELGDGPCLLAYRSGTAVAVPDLRNESRFADFRLRVLDVGLAAVFSFPLRDGDQQIGTLDLYRETPGALSADEMTAAEMLADVAAAYCRDAQTRVELLDSLARSRHAALHDALTGLPNRTLLLDRLALACVRRKRSGGALAVLSVDLDGFGRINHTHGRGAGDELLIAAAERLTAILSPGDTLARLAADEFVILCEDADGSADQVLIGARVQAALASAFVLSSAVVDVSAAVGVAYVEGASSPSTSSTMLVPRCTRRSASGVPAFRCPTRSAAIGRIARQAGSATCTGRWSAVSSESSTSRSSPPAVGRSPTSRRCSAGTTPLAAWCHRPSSSRSPSKRA